MGYELRHSALTIWRRQLAAIVPVSVPDATNRKKRQRRNGWWNPAGDATSSSRHGYRRQTGTGRSGVGGDNCSSSEKGIFTFWPVVRTLWETAGGLLQWVERVHRQLPEAGEGLGSQAGRGFSCLFGGERCV
ncbi:hypothetical protein AGIG_G20688 [Arapaima gigas]